MSKLRASVRRILRSAEQLAHAKAIAPLIFSNTEQIPIDDYDEQDVFVVGFPKSGNTWFQNIAAGLVYGVTSDFIPDSLVQELVPDVHYKRYYRRIMTPTFFKSHYLPQPDYRRVVYLMRDGRDVMVSYYHHLTALDGHAPDFLRLVREGDRRLPSQWPEHIAAWEANPYNAQMVTIKYEDLKRDTVNELVRFCEFAGLERDRALLELVAEKTSFGSMLHREGRFGRANPQWPKDKPFIRRGTVGSHKDEMPAEVLDTFLEGAGEALRRYGYL